MKANLNSIVLLLILGILAASCIDNKEGRQEVVNQDTNSLQQSIAFCAPSLSDQQWFNSKSKAPLLDGLEVLEYPITTINELVQRYFNQGLMLAYGFNHAEAARSFYYATKLDSTCAMAHWGYAYVLGPNYNAGMEPDNYQRAYDAIQKAQALLTPENTEKERVLIAALAKRYTPAPIEDRTGLDMAYSEALAEAHQQFPEDADIATLYAESQMDLHPWDLWEKEGTPKEWTVALLATFDKVFALDSLHPGAHHFYIHAVEASGNPALGLKSAGLYDADLVPGAGHLVHMPAHIYIRTGDYHKGTVSNQRSILVDSTYLSNCAAQGTYPLTLYPHNFHFMSATATLEGDSKTALFAAQKVADHANRQLMQTSGWGTIQHYYTIPYYVKVKFGRWEEILEMKNEDPALPYPAAVRHYARGMAYTALNDKEKANLEWQQLQKFASQEELKQVTIWETNTTHDLLQIALRVLESEILALDSKWEQSIVLLKEAVELEANLNYQEPPDWFFSVRHSLGAMQLKAGKHTEAVATYLEDLKELPKNGWALHGLKKAYQNLQDQKRTEQVELQLKEVWKYSDIQLTSSIIE